MNKQTRFSVLQISPYVVQNCDARKSRYQKLKSRAAFEGAHEEREFETFGRLRLSDVPPSQRRHHTESSLRVCAATWVWDILIFFQIIVLTEPIYIYFYTFDLLHHERMRAGRFRYKRGRTRRSCEKPVTGEWCESPRTSRLQL